jgi:hypothetical protein
MTCITLRMPETSHDPSPIPSIASGVMMQLGVADPVPTLEAPPVSRLSKQGLWACAEAGFTNVLRSLFLSQRPGEVHGQARSPDPLQEEGSGASPRVDAGSGDAESIVMPSADASRVTWAMSEVGGRTCAEPPLEMGSIKPHMVVPSQIS